jgi:hypothetical protein
MPEEGFSRSRKHGEKHLKRPTLKDAEIETSSNSTRLELLTKAL